MHACTGRRALHSSTLTSHAALVAAQVFSDNVTEVNFRPEDGRADVPPQPVPQLSMGDMRKDLVFLDIASDPAFAAIQQVRAPRAAPPLRGGRGRPPAVGLFRRGPAWALSPPPTACCISLPAVRHVGLTAGPHA